MNYLRNNREVFPKFESKDEEQLFTKELQFWDMKEDLQKLLGGQQPEELRPKPVEPSTIKREEIKTEEAQIMQPDSVIRSRPTSKLPLREPEKTPKETGPP